MITIKKLMEILQELPDDALAYAYEGEVIGIVIVSAQGRELGYVPTKDSGSNDVEFIKNKTKS